jgi:N-acetylmuramoyl-L-alanine amidase
VTIKASMGRTAPVTVKDVRVFSTPERTRLVLDLDRQMKAVERRSARSRSIVIALPNATLSPATRTLVRRGAVPAPLSVSQSSSRSVTVALLPGSFSRYKQFSLANPPRLVVDVVPSSPLPPVLGLDPGGQPPSADAPPQPPPPQSKPYRTIVIDPGHGGKDPGARGRRGTEEKDITLKVALELRDLLSKQPGVRVLMTRERDMFIDLEDRAKFANTHDADLFVSVHVNSHPSRSVNGLEIYHFGEAKDQRALEVAARENGTPLSSTGVGWEYLVADLLTTKKVEESLDLAWSTKQAMVGHMNGHYPVNDHGVKTAPFYVLRFTSMPSILAEIAYISNPEEETLLRKPAFIRDVANSLFQGVKSYLAHSKTTAK